MRLVNGNVKTNKELYKIMDSKTKKLIVKESGKAIGNGGLAVGNVILIIIYVIVLIAIISIPVIIYLNFEQ